MVILTNMQAKRVFAGVGGGTGGVGLPDRQRAELPPKKDKPDSTGG
ncbi:hypothetical protein L1285_21285 [Pseudoalteromonas sp. DL2-H2.2]|nr:hypothetical protein [Pseudoalteromonas sp. DL2-H2.2]MCF2910845.1 hypothetical protein [Pseudoalteromonas sp. DL2-H2.2]